MIIADMRIEKIDECRQNNKEWNKFIKLLPKKQISNRNSSNNKESKHSINYEYFFKIKSGQRQIARESQKLRLGYDV